MNLTFSKKTTLRFSKVSGKSIVASLRRTSPYFLWLLFLVVILWLGYVWYSSLYTYDWTEDQKQQYQTSYAGETSFREERFTQTVALLKERIRIHQTFPIVIKDIFTYSTF